jgi:hypothetical protein
MTKQYETRGSFLSLLASSLAMISTAAVWLVPGGGGLADAAMAPIEPYLVAGGQQEIALARSAAPPSIAGQASVMVLEKHGYITAVKGTNGFVCLVVRSWAKEFDAKSAEFFDPKFHAPYCLNASAAHSVLPPYLMRTQWVIAGASEKEIAEREKAEWAAGKFEEPKPGALCYMMSKHGNLGDGTPWRPHVMFYVPHAQASSWGANLQGAPIMAGAGDHTTVFFVLVPFWSDGTPAPLAPD